MKVIISGSPINVHVDDDSVITSSDSVTIHTEPVQTNVNVGLDSETIVAVSGLGLQGPPGPAGPSGQSYVHPQNIASADWTINHDLGFYPNVVVETSAGDTVEGEIEYSNVNTVILHFSGSFAGTAYLS